MTKVLTLGLFLLLMNKCFGQRLQGCFASGGSYSSSYQKFNSSGNPQLDQFIGTDVTVLKTFFNVYPVAYYYADNDSPNAFFDPQNNTVNIGFNLINKNFIVHHNVTTVPIIVAHEFGHCVDHKYSATPGRGIKAELFADFMAGVFLRYRSNLTWTDIYGTLNEFFNLGDDLEFTDPNHHGTNLQRLNTIRSGYNWYSAHYNSSVEDIVEAAKTYLGISTTSDDSDSMTDLRKNRGNNTNSSSYEIKKNITIVTFNPTSSTDGSQTTYKYRVKVYNKNDFDVSLEIGGLSYGHYQNCDASSVNYVKDGNFDTQNVTVAANSSDAFYFEITLEEHHPNACSGVRPYQQAKILSASSR